MEKNFSLIILFIMVAITFFLIGFVSHIIVQPIYGYKNMPQLDAMFFANCVSKETNLNPDITQTELKIKCDAYVADLKSMGDSVSSGIDQVRNEFYTLD